MKFVLPKTLTILLFSFSLLSIFYFLFFNSALIQKAEAGIKISPIRFEEIVDPGEVLETSIKVTNLFGRPVILYAFLNDFKAGLEEGGRPILIPPGAEQGPFLATWINITTEGIYFEPGEKKEIPFTIKVPKETGPGGYYGAILFGTEPPEIIGGQTVIAIGKQVASLLLLHISGEVIEEAMIREFSVDKTLYNTPFKIDFITRVENKGNVHIKPHGIIQISNMWGREVEALRVNEPGANILPVSIRRFENRWEGEMGFGRYRAELALTYGTPADLGGEGKKTLSSALYFWIIPWGIVIPGILGLIFFVALLILSLKIYKSQAIKKAMREAGLGQVRYIRKYRGPSLFLHFGLFIIVLLVLTFLLIGGLVFFLFLRP